MNNFDQDKRNSDRASRDEDVPEADFSDLVGRWEDDPAFEEIIASQRKIDWTKW